MVDPQSQAIDIEPADPQDDLRARIRSDGRLRPVVVAGIPALLLLSAGGGHYGRIHQLRGGAGPSPGAMHGAALTGIATTCRSTSRGTSTSIIV